MTRIGIDVRWLHDGLTHDRNCQMLGGIGNYGFHLVPRLIRYCPDIQFVLFYNRQRPKEVLKSVFGSFSNVVLVSLPPAVRVRVADSLYGALLRSLQDVAFVSTAVRHEKLDLFHSLSQFVPAYGSEGTKRIVTIHDIIHVAFPYRRYYLGRFGWQRFLKGYARCDAIIADSNHTKRDIVRYLDIASDKVTPIYLGVGPEYAPIVEHERIESVRTRYKIGNPYLLYVGGLQHNKNVPTLLRSFCKFRNEHGDEFSLVMVGAERRFYLRQYRALVEQLEMLGIQRDVRLLSFIPNWDLAALYNGASAFVFPSLYEGFGLPLVEAMACGTPVITSRASAIPEVVGDAGYGITDPLNSDEIAQAINAVVRDEHLRRHLRQKGLSQAARFSWDTTARETLNVYQTALEG